MSGNLGSQIGSPPFAHTTQYRVPQRNCMEAFFQRIVFLGGLHDRPKQKAGCICRHSNVFLVYYANSARVAMRPFFFFFLSSWQEVSIMVSISVEYLFWHGLFYYSRRGRTGLFYMQLERPSVSNSTGCWFFLPIPTGWRRIRRHARGSGLY